MRSRRNATSASPGTDDEERRGLTFAISFGLILLGVALAIYAGVIRTNLHTDAAVCVLSGPDTADTPSAHEDEPPIAPLSPTELAACPSAPLGSLVRISQFTVTRRNASDTLLTALLATAAVLVLSGAFFTRIETISGPGGLSLSMAKRRDRNDAKRAVETVASALAVDIPNQQIDRAKSIAQQEAVDLREFAIGRRPVPPLPVDEDRLEELRRGNPLPSDLLEALAQDAVEKAIAESAGND